MKMTLTDFHVLDAMQRFGGGFVRALAEAGMRADAENLSRLRSAFPEYWEEYRLVAQESKEKAK